MAARRALVRIPGMSSEAFLIVHGWLNERPEGHWQHLLADALRADGASVDYPQFPNPKAPVPARWLETLDAALDRARGRDLTVVGHSLGAVLWLLAAARPQGVPRVHRVLLVAPPAREQLLRQPELRAFAEFRPEPHAVRDSSEQPPLFVGGDADPWCPRTVAVEYAAEYECPAVTVPGGPHFALEDGYGPWPAVIDWCRQGSADFIADTPAAVRR